MPDQPHRPDGVICGGHASILKGDVNPKGLNELTGGSTSDSWPWPDDLDAMVAAPGFHTVLFEYNRVRVLDGRVPPGVPFLVASKLSCTTI